MTDKNKKPESKKPESKKPESKKPESKKPKSKNKVRVLPSPRRVTNLLPLKPKPRDPKRKPNTKIFDIIENIIKTPFKIRGGDYEYKANGGMMNKRSSFMGGGLAYKGGGITMKKRKK